jgi:hypothetical protein
MAVCLALDGVEEHYPVLLRLLESVKIVFKSLGIRIRFYPTVEYSINFKKAGLLGDPGEVVYVEKEKERPITEPYCTPDVTALASDDSPRLSVFESSQIKSSESTSGVCLGYRDSIPA